MHLAVAILRTEKGFDYSDILTTDVVGSGAMKTSNDDQLNGSMSDLLAVGQTQGSNDSLNRIESQGIAKACAYLHDFYFSNIPSFVIFTASSSSDSDEAKDTASAPSGLHKHPNKNVRYGRNLNACEL